MERRILHLRINSFPVAVYQVKDPSLRGRPVVVSAGRGPRAVVLSASAEARAQGIRPGMTLPQAQRWCRSVLSLVPDPILFDRAERAIGDLLARACPVVEPARHGRFFADLTGTRRLLGTAPDVAHRLQKEIAASLRLFPSAGLGSNKLISGVAARLPRQASLIDVSTGGEASFLSPLTVRLLPATEPRADAPLMEELGIRRIADLMTLQLIHLTAAFGSRAGAFYRQARGIDESPVRPPERAPEVSADETFADDTNDDAALGGAFFRLVERCGARLRRTGQAAGEAVVTARYTDGMAATNRLILAPPLFNDLTLFATLDPLLEKTTVRRGRVRYLRLRLTRLGPSVPAQRSLFENEATDRGEARREPPLIAALDRIRGRYGDTAIGFGRSTGLGTKPSGQESGHAS